MLIRNEKLSPSDGSYNVGENELGYDRQIQSPLPMASGVVAGRDLISRSLLSSLVASTASLLFGYSLGYTSPTQKDIEKELLDAATFSWFASLVAIGAIIGCLFGAYLIEKVGRKTSIMALSIFHTPGWCLICYGKNVQMLFVGRLLTGIAVGIASLAVPMYIAEVASARLRGVLGTIHQLSITVGIFIVYFVGFAMSWRWAAIVPVIITAFMVLGMFFMPESPRWLLSKNQRHQALQDLKWLRGPDYDVDEECFEIESNLDQQSRITFAEFKDPSLYRPLLIGSFLMVFQQLTGINAVILYCTKIFDLAEIHNAKAVSLSVAGAQIFFTGLACFLVDKSGRKILLMIGGIVMFLSLFLLGVYFDLVDVQSDDNRISIFGKFSHSYSAHKISYFAVLCVILYIAVFSIGWGPMPWLLMSELFPPRAKSPAGGAVAIINWIFVFITTSVFHQIVQTLYGQGTFWLFAGFCLLSFVFTLFCVPETKGKTLEEIEEMFSRHR